MVRDRMETQIGREDVRVGGRSESVRDGQRV